MRRSIRAANGSALTGEGIWWLALPGRPDLSLCGETQQAKRELICSKAVETGHKNRKGYGTHQCETASTRGPGRNRIQDPNSARISKKREMSKLFGIVAADNAGRGGTRRRNSSEFTGKSKQQRMIQPMMDRMKTMNESVLWDQSGSDHTRINLRDGRVPSGSALTAVTAAANT